MWLNLHRTLAHFSRFPCVCGYFEQLLSDVFQFPIRMIFCVLQELEPFVSRCRSVAQSLLSVLQELAQLDNLPQSVSDAHKIIAQHEQCVRRAFDNPQLAEVQSEAEEVLHRLRNMGETLKYSHDYM